MLNSSENKMAVIGLGNTLRCDDGIGIYLLSILQERHKDSPVTFLNFGISSFGLVNYIREYKKVLLIDAIDAGIPSSTLKIFNLFDASYEVKEKKISSHELSLGDLLELCRALNISSDIYVAGIQVKDTSCGLEMTGELQAAVSGIADEISKFIVICADTSFEKIALKKAS